MRRRRLIILLVATALVLVACTAEPLPRPPRSGSRDTPSEGSATGPVPPFSKVAAPEPGLETLAGGRVVAKGWLDHVDIDGGTWRLVNQPATSSMSSVVIAVLIPDEVSEARLFTLMGSFIGAEGRIKDGTADSPDGPVVVVETVRAY
ncbi:MAG: hypothetical protein Q7W30_06195 [Coriobacteriia bacterium]|nr:hypothetical protein [Coriobacteriia bacterium]